MIDENNVYDELDLNGSQEKILELAKTAGITVESGSVEEQLSNWLSQFLLEFDKNLFKSYQLQFNPVGSEIDIQNPNTPRLLTQRASGYLFLTNNTGSDINVIVNSLFTAPNGNVYTTENNTVVVPASGGTNTIAVYSVLEGIEQNLPGNQSFTSSYALTAVNPEPFINGRDNETDTEYLNRLIYDRTNNSSYQSTQAAINELLESYKMARIYINNNSNATPLPIIIPPNGYLPVVQFPSGTAATSAEIQTALTIMSNRFEFGNPKSNPTDLHPLKLGTIYSGSFPEIFYVTPAQAVETTITSTIGVSFIPNIDATEKNNLANAFATFFAQNIVNYFGGAAGNFTCIFTPSGESPIQTDISLIAAQGINAIIAPAFSIEQIRALISDKEQLSVLFGLEYKTCPALSVLLDPLVAGESQIELNITGGGGSVLNVDFTTDALFTDGSSWYDRYIYIDPSLITINVNEI